MNEGSQNTKFRTAVAGYNKEDVNVYIASMHNQFQFQMDALHAQLQSTEKTLAEAQAAIEAKENACAQAQASVAAGETERQDLQAHLEEAQAAAAERLKRMNICLAQVDAQNVAMSSLREELRTATQKLQEAEKQQETDRQALTDKEAALLRDADHIRTLETNNAAQEKELAAYREQVQNLTDTLSAERTAHAAALEKLRAEKEEEGAEYKVQMYDKISGQVGDILLNANRSADEILSAAREEAEHLRAEAAEETEKMRSDCQAEVTRLRNDTESEANYIRERLSDTAATILEEISKELHGNMDNCVKEIQTSVTEMQYATTTLLQSLDQCGQELSDRIQYYRGCVNDSVQKKLAQMDEKYGIAAPDRKAVQE